MATVPNVACAPAPMAGTLHRYGPLAHQLAFIASPPEPTWPPPPPTLHVVLLAGLTEGLLALPYAPHLAGRIAAINSVPRPRDLGHVSLVQVQLRSSYDGWGRASLDGDADELLLLMAWLRREQRSRGVVLIGHSTGCQIACRLCERHHDALVRAAAQAKSDGDAQVARLRQRRDGPPRPPLTPSRHDADPSLPAMLVAVCLQAPVSDRDYFFAAHPQEASAWLADAKAAIAAGDPERIVAVVEGSPLAARRAVALLERLGDDDMFSRDLTAMELVRTSLGFVGKGGTGSADDGPPFDGRQVLVLASGADEYVPPLLLARQGGGAPRAVKLALIEQDVARVVAAAAAGAGVGGERLVKGAVIAGAPHNGAGMESEVAEDISEWLGMVVRQIRKAILLDL